MKILCADIGGTHTRLAVMKSRPDGGFDAESRTLLPSRELDSLEHPLREFRSGPAAECEVASLGVAGPVVGRRCRATNLPWTLDADELEVHLGLRRVELLNDLEAQAHGIAALDQKQLLTLHAGEPQPGNAALLAAGTGLGQAGLFFDGERLVPFATEGGHTDFAPRNELEFRLLRFLQGRFGRVSWERVLSGPGLQQLYDFLVQVENLAPEPELHRQLGSESVAGSADAATADPAAAITNAALSGSCPAASAALDLFVELLGSEAANLALKLMARGGVFLGGGIAPKILGRLHRPFFIEAFCAKGRMRPILEKMPIIVVLATDTALLGAARFAATSERPVRVELERRFGVRPG